MTTTYVKEDVIRRMRSVQGGDCGIRAARNESEAPVNLTKGRLLRMRMIEADEGANLLCFIQLFYPRSARLE